MAEPTAQAAAKGGRFGDDDLDVVRHAYLKVALVLQLHNLPFGDYSRRA